MHINEKTGNKKKCKYITNEKNPNASRISRIMQKKAQFNKYFFCVLYSYQLLLTKYSLFQQ